MSNKDFIEQELITKIKNGDESAFIQVYDFYWKRLYNFGYKKLAKKEVVEGMVQDVFIDFWNKRTSLEIHTSLKSYLYTSIKYKIINQYKLQGIRDIYIEKEKAKGEQNHLSVEEHIFFKDLKSNLNSVVENFPPQRRKVYELRFDRGFSNIEISKYLKISVSTVEKHMIRAMKEIRVSLREFTFSLFSIEGLEILINLI